MLPPLSKKKKKNQEDTVLHVFFLIIFYFFNSSKVINWQISHCVFDIGCKLKHDIWSVVHTENSFGGKKGKNTSIYLIVFIQDDKKSVINNEVLAWEGEQDRKFP